VNTFEASSNKHTGSFTFILHMTYFSYIIIRAS
jgi:hypothetical protein